MKAYRPEIDGLRAIAVLPVLLYHAGFTFFSGGFLGVDVFFVISGYLITQILYQEISERRFSLLDFYERRARRIIPALAVVACLSVLPAWVLMRPDQLNSFGSSLVGVASYSSNMTFWLGQGYFEESSDLIPLLHTWSLAVEEQFYLFFPPILLFLVSKFKSQSTSFVFSICLVSIGLSVWATNLQSRPMIASGAFFLLPTRAWELGLGACVALLQAKRAKQLFLQSLWVRYLPWMGLFLIIVPMVTYDSSTPFPGVATIPPVLGACIIIALANSKTALGRILALRLFVGIGLISYSLYLWHNPIFSFYRIYKSEVDIPQIWRIALIAISLVLALLSWRYIERPFRSKAYLNRSTIFGLTVMTTVALLGLGYGSSSASKNFEYKLAQELRHSNYVYFSNMDERSFTAARLKSDLPYRDTVFLGSSRIMQVSSANYGDPIYNFGVSGASVEDLIGFGTQVVDRMVPETIYIAADPWLFNKYDGQERWRSISFWTQNGSDAIIRGTSIIDSQASPTSSVSLLTRMYSAVNIARLATDSSEVETIAKKAFDGSHVYARSYAELSDAEIARLFDSNLNYSMQEYSHDWDAQNKYKLLISWMKREGIEVKLFLSPYHPELYARFHTEKPQILEAEERFRLIANELNVQIVGSYDPSKVGCLAKEFYDGIHPKGECVARIFH